VGRRRQDAQQVRPGRLQPELDSEDRLTSVTYGDGTLSDHTYDADGVLMETDVLWPTGTSSVTKFVVDTSRSLSHIQADVELQPSGAYATGERLVRFGDVLLGRMDAGGAFYIHGDHLGSVREVSDAAGSFVASVDYAPYGTPLVDEDEEYLFAGERFSGSIHAERPLRWPRA